MKTIEEQLVRTIDLVNLCSETDIYSVYVNERNICIRCRLFAFQKKRRRAYHNDEWIIDKYKRY